MRQGARLLAALAAGAILAAPHATAETVSLAGTWTINVQEQAPCEFAGQIHLRPVDQATYEGTLTMRHACPFFEDGEIIANQESRVSVKGNQVSVISKVVEFPMQEDWSDSYAPDNFALTVQSPNRLFGIQTDRYGTLPAEWVRTATGIS